MEVKDKLLNEPAPIGASKVYNEHHGIINPAPSSQQHSLAKIRFPSMIFSTMPSVTHPLFFSALAAAAALPQTPGFAVPSLPSFSIPSLPTLPAGLGSGSASGFSFPTGLPTLPGLGSSSLPSFGTGGIASLPTIPTTSSSGATSAGSCTEFMLIFARGTGEEQGLGIVGTPLDEALQKQFTSYSSYAVVYPAAVDQDSTSGSEDAL